LQGGVLLQQATGVHLNTAVVLPLVAWPGAGEQHRFHFDMSKCIGCKCCVVACNEQNGNPAAINWRRVGEIEGGYFPHARRHYISMGCNHCLEPSCLTGCPVEAYEKDPRTGIVTHSAEACIGCQYCTWNCSYGVPQYNPERGVVGKCDLCRGRLEDGMSPACVAACPEGAIEIEVVDMAAWRRDYLAANAPGLPSADDSISTTRVTLPGDLPPDAGRVDTGRVTPEQPHWPLVFMLVVTQLAVGAFLALWLLDVAGKPETLRAPALTLLALAAASLAASTLHLGRPAYAWRALRGLRHSWLSREVLAFSLFAGAASLYAGMLFLDRPERLPTGLAAALAGLAGVACSARIYLVPARPAWNSRYTVAAFFGTALLLGPLFVLAMGASGASWLTGAAVAGGAAQWMGHAFRFLWLARSEQFELKASALLLSSRLRHAFVAYLALLAAGTALPLAAPPAWALAAALLAEFLGRWLFFVSVVPKNMALAFAFPKGTAA